MPDLRTAVVPPEGNAFSPPADVLAGSDTWRPASVRRALPSGISDTMADDTQRLLDELQLRHDAFEQQGQVLRQLQAALQRSQATNQELALVADRVTDALVICDAQRCISWVNPAFARLTGFTLTECHGQQPEELLSGPHTDPATIMRINQVLAKGEGIEHLEVCHHRKDGEPFWVSRSVQPVAGPDGQVQRYIEVLTDITDRRRVGAEHAHRLQAEVALAGKVEFISRMSHSMRSPLNAILGFTQLLDMDAQQLPEPQRRHIGHIHTAGQQLLSLIDQALAFAKIDDKPMGIRPQRVELAVLLREVRAALEDDALANDITVVVDCQCPAVWADGQHARAILMNLMGNAIQYSPRGATVWLHAKASGDAREGIVEVRDQGYGIDAGDLPRLFQPFTRLDNPAAGHTHGNGLGLAVSQRLAELMHGRIDVTSTLGRGSVFALHLPLAELNTRRNQGDPTRAHNESVMLPPLRVVHIEDNALNRSLVEAMFAAYPHVRLISAETAAEGMQCIQSQHPDVALVDINLPDGSGLDLCRKLRAQAEFKKLPLIALSADALPEHIARALQTGFSHYLVKPLQINRLLHILAALPSAQAAPPTR
jgi:PAS domain S-box-containing protein